MLWFLMAVPRYSEREFRVLLAVDGQIDWMENSRYPLVAMAKDENYSKRICSYVYSLRAFFLVAC